MPKALLTEGVSYDLLTASQHAFRVSCSAAAQSQSLVQGNPKQGQYQLNIGDSLRATLAYYLPSALVPFALREEKCFTVRCNPSSTDTFGMYPSSWRALLQSSWRFAFAMRMRIGVNSDAAMVCAACFSHCRTAHAMHSLPLPVTLKSYIS